MCIPLCFRWATLSQYATSHTAHDKKGRTEEQDCYVRLVMHESLGGASGSEESGEPRRFLAPVFYSWISASTSVASSTSDSCHPR